LPHLRSLLSALLDPKSVLDISLTNICTACLPLGARDYVYSLSPLVQYNDSSVVIFKKVKTNAKRETQKEWLERIKLRI